MELIVLGCWAPYPRAGGACSGYLVRGGGVNVLLEAGNGSLSRLLRWIDFRSLDAVVVSHLHHDHYLDLFPLRHAVEGARREGRLSGPLKLVLPAEPEEVHQQLACYTKAFEAVPIESLPWEKTAGGARAHGLNVNGLRFRFVPAVHSLPAYSFSVQHKESKLVYSGDTARSGELVDLAGGAGLFLCEASGLDDDLGYLKGSHLTAREAGEVAREAGLKRLLITHLWPEYDPEELARQAGEGFGGQVMAAQEGETYPV